MPPRVVVVGVGFGGLAAAVPFRRRGRVAHRLSWGILERIEANHYRVFRVRAALSRRRGRWCGPPVRVAGDAR